MMEDQGHQAMWQQAIAALAEIDTALGLPADGCNSTARTLVAIRSMQARITAMPYGLIFDAFGELRKRYVRVSLGGNHCVIPPSDGDRYVQDARDAGDESPYVVSDVWLSEREFDDLPEHDGF